MSEILDLINRKNAEIERLNGYLDVISYSTGKIKAEAIKEFAERLKAKEAVHFCKCGQPFVYTDLFNGEIDQIAKEMGVEL